MQIGIIGVGAIGQALATVLAQKEKVDVKCWDANPEKMPKPITLPEVVSSSEVLFMCMQSWIIREALLSVLPNLSKETLVITLAKGIEKETNYTVDEVLHSVLHMDQPAALLAGPLLASGVVQGLPSIGVLAADHAAVFDTGAELFKGTSMSLEYSRDMHGVALAGVLKNIYAIGLGMSEGFNLGENFCGWYIFKACEEMSLIIEELGGDKMTAFSHAGIGDLVATGYSSDSRNHRVGVELATSGKANSVSEGIASMDQLIGLLKGQSGKYRLLTALSQSVKDGIKAKGIFIAACRDK